MKVLGKTLQLQELRLGNTIKVRSLKNLNPLLHLLFKLMVEIKARTWMVEHLEYFKTISPPRSYLICGRAELKKLPCEGSQ